MMHNFTYEALPVRVIFGQGKIQTLPQEAQRLGIQRALVLCTPQQVKWAQEVSSLLGDSCVGLFHEAAMHTPVDVTLRAVEYARSVHADGLISLGGGSTTGLGKAISLRTGLPQIAVPTTYAGSEMTGILGETENGIKTTQKKPEIQPEAVIYDVDLTMSLPAALSGTSGLNAMAHAIEALYAQDRNPVTTLMALEAIAAFGRALPVIAKQPDDVAARSDALYGAWFCGICLGSAGMALHHKLCHVLGGAFDLPHAETHAVMLPHTTGYNMAAAAEVMEKVATALHAPNAARGLWNLARSIDAPRSLKELGMPEDGIDHATDLALRNPYWNPEPLTREGIHGLIKAAWAGDQPLQA